MLQRRVGVELWRLVLVVLWFGLVFALSFVEAPLKFQAPGITIPLGLGIGRIVFAALNLAEGVLLLALTVLTFWPREARVSAGRVRWWLVAVVLYAVKMLVVRPPLNARTDLVLEGANPGESVWHYVYIACDVMVLVVLVVLAVQSAKAVCRLVVNEPARSLSSG